MKPIFEKNCKKISCAHQTNLRHENVGGKKLSAEIFPSLIFSGKGAEIWDEILKNFSLYLSIPVRIRNLTKIFEAREKNPLHLYNRVRTKKFNEIIKKVEKSKAGKNIKAVFRLFILWFCWNRTWRGLFAGRCNGMERRVDNIYSESGFTTKENRPLIENRKTKTEKSLTNSEQTVIV